MYGLTLQRIWSGLRVPNRNLDKWVQQPPQLSIPVAYNQALWRGNGVWITELQIPSYPILLIQFLLYPFLESIFCVRPQCIIFVSVIPDSIIPFTISHVTPFFIATDSVIPESIIIIYSLIRETPDMMSASEWRGVTKKQTK